MPRSCGWNTSDWTKVSSAGWLAATAIDPASTTWPLAALSQDLLVQLPPADAYAKAASTLDEQAAAKEAITTKWDSVVGATSSNGRRQRCS